MLRQPDLASLIDMKSLRIPVTGCVGTVSLAHDVDQYCLAIIRARRLRQRLTGIHPVELVLT